MLFSVFIQISSTNHAFIFVERCASTAKHAAVTKDYVARWGE